MAQLEWDKVGERQFESGVDHGVLYIRDNAGQYTDAHVWNGLTKVGESPEGGEATESYADNIPYIRMVSVEKFNGTIEAFSSPIAFDACDGTREVATGVIIGQQERATFGFAYRTKVGNDIAGQDAAYKIHLVYGALAKPSARDYNTINESPEATPLSWEFTTSPVPVTGAKPTATVSFRSDEVPATELAELEDILFGTASTMPRLPLPDEIIALVGGGTIPATATAPTFNGTDTVTIPVVTGVVYQVSGSPVTGTIDLDPAETVTVTAVAGAGYSLTPGTHSWNFTGA